MSFTKKITVRFRLYKEKIVKEYCRWKLIKEFGTNDVEIQETRLFWGPKFSVVCEIHNSRVGEDFFHVRLVRITARNAWNFLSIGGMMYFLTTNFAFGFFVREVESIEVSNNQKLPPSFLQYVCTNMV
jgi:hypothetical protein